MKNNCKLFLFVLVICIVLAFNSCDLLEALKNPTDSTTPECEHIDIDSDGICDECYRYKLVCVL